MTTIDEPPWRGAELFVRPGFQQRLRKLLRAVALALAPRL